MSKYQQRLIDHINSHPEFVQPDLRRNEILARLKEPLQDLSASRTTFTWGIPVPGDEKHVMYVWFDALTNYVSGKLNMSCCEQRTLQPTQTHPMMIVMVFFVNVFVNLFVKVFVNLFVSQVLLLVEFSTTTKGKRWSVWSSFACLHVVLKSDSGVGYTTDNLLSRYWPANVHLIGKDISWFHCVIWPCILMSANIPLPTSVFAHGFVVAADGRKMSKSIGNVVDPVDLLKHWPNADTFRYIFDGTTATSWCPNVLISSNRHD